MKLNIGCGKKHLKGYLSIDKVPTEGAPPPDILADAWDIPLENGVADEILAIHVFEHFYLWQISDVLKEWNRLLQNGGKLVLEMPDIVKAAKNLLNGTIDQMSMWAFYGDPRYKDELMCHHWGWTFKTIVPILAAYGFQDCVEERTLFHSVGSDHRDFRVVSRKYL